MKPFLTAIDTTNISLYKAAKIRPGVVSKGSFSSDRPDGNPKGQHPFETKPRTNVVFKNNVLPLMKRQRNFFVQRPAHVMTDGANHLAVIYQIAFSLIFRRIV
jgi:hypothetical protein